MAAPWLADRDDVDALRTRYAADGVVRIERLLVPEAADALAARLAEWDRWALVTRLEGEHRSFDAAAVAGVDDAGRARLRSMIEAEARRGFQYAYERFPLYDPDYDAALDDALLQRLCGLLREGPLLALVRAVTGDEDIAFADGQATRFRAGHFLTRHDDHADGKARVAAYVFGLTRNWRPDHGGQLQLLDGADVRRAYVPGFNSLTLFRVPQPHLVTAVAPWVAESRLSVTGWFRRADGRPPA